MPARGSSPLIERRVGRPSARPLATGRGSHSCSAGSTWPLRCSRPPPWNYGPPARADGPPLAHVADDCWSYNGVLRCGAGLLQERTVCLSGLLAFYVPVVIWGGYIVST